MTSPLAPLIRRTLAPLSAYKAFAQPFPAKLDANESPWSLPPAARARIAERLSLLDYNRYPDAGAHELREALAGRLGADDPDSLVLGVGSDEPIAMLMRTLSEPKQGQARARVLFPDPSFVMYEMRAIVEDLEPVAVALDGAFQLDMERMAQSIERARPNLIFLASPNNPTGNCFRSEDIERTIELAPDALVVIDEAYGAFSGRTLSPLMARFPNVAVMGTLSKIGFAAARVGWVRLPRELADAVEKSRQPYNLNSLSQAVATLALTELWPTLEAQIAAIREERTRLGEALAELPRLTLFPSDANFFLVRVERDAQELAARLLERGVSVRAFKSASSRLAGHLRITVGTPAENDLLLANLRPLL
jgi:histidinol-phosphate aminotransferase